MGLFIQAAESILREFRRPMSSDELTDHVIKFRPEFSNGKTPRNTMRARLSEELRKNGANSVFQRVGKNKFALREWKLRGDYIALEFVKPIPPEELVCFSSTNPLFQGNDVNGIFPIKSDLRSLLKNRDQIKIIPRLQAENTFEYKQLVSYVLLRSDDGRILTYIRGKYSAAHKTLLRGRHSLGFGGHVLHRDVDDLFGADDAGISNAAKREVAEELKGYTPQTCMLSRVIFDNTSSEGYKHLGIVVESPLPHKFNYNKYRKELSINGVKLMSPAELWDNFHLFEYWSQLVIREFFGSFRPRIISSIAPKRAPKNARNIVLAGEIASGKTTILDTIAKMDNFCYVSARQCLVEILNVPDFKNRNRSEFQAKAQAFIETKSGPQELANSIASKVDPNKTNLIDGIRNISTIKELKRLLGECIVVYIEAPRNKALENYQNRAGIHYSNADFVEAREHQTEMELPLILEEADAVLFNADSADNTIQIFSNWILNKKDDEFLR